MRVEVRLPTAGSPHTPRKRDPHWEMVVVVVLHMVLVLVTHKIGRVFLSIDYLADDTLITKGSNGAFWWFLLALEDSLVYAPTVILDF